jgi:hypothetical protein
VRSTKSLSWISDTAGRLLGFGPVAPPPHVFALDRGALRYAAFGGDGAALRLQDWRAVELPADAFHSGPLGGPLKDVDAFRRAIATLRDQAPAPPREAALVIPDGWLRLAFTEVGDLPKGGEARDEVLRWKLKRLVPFRVDELRVRGVEVEPLPGQSEPRRVLLGFAVEALLEQLEEAFAAEGVRVGHLSNPSLSLLAALRRGEALPDDELAAVALAGEDGWSLTFARRGEPLLHRYKPVDGGLPLTARSSFVTRDLRLTASFLDDYLGGEKPRRVLLVAPPELEGQWLAWIESGLGTPGEALRPEHLPLATADLVPAWRDAAALLGAACEEVG